MNNNVVCRQLAGVFLALTLLSVFRSGAQTLKDNRLKAAIMKIVDTSRAHIGVGVMGLDFPADLRINGSGHFPMQSVFKFPLAVTVLHQADQGKISLDKKVHIANSSLDKDTWSPIVTDFPGRDVDLSVADLLRYTMSKSDNNGCDILFRQSGGTKATNSYMHSLGIAGMSVVATEAEMKKAWEGQYRNWCSPDAMLQLLQKVYRGNILSDSSRSFLLRIMTESVNNNRIKGMLPATAIVAHKTGTSGTNAKGIKAATNDVGIITLPDGRHIALVVYVSDYRGGLERGERIIAAISRLVWDHYVAE